MKKLICLLILLLNSHIASAQMIDTIGALGIQGELTSGAYRGMGQMQNAISGINFQQDLSTLLVNVQSRFLGNYSALSKETADFNGFQGLDWNIGANGANSFYIEFNGLDIATCMNCKNQAWGYKSIDINHGSDCNGNDYVKMTF